jgi:hypothetical protein
MYNLQKARNIRRESGGNGGARYSCRDATVPAMEEFGFVGVANGEK